MRVGGIFSPDYVRIVRGRLGGSEHRGSRVLISVHGLFLALWVGLGECGERDSGVALEYFFGRWEGNMGRFVA